MYRVALPPVCLQHFVAMLRGGVGPTGDWAGAGVGGGAKFIKEAHLGIAGRPFAALGMLGRPVRVVHDRVSAAAYDLVYKALAAGPRALVRFTPGNGIPAANTLRGSLALGALNGAVGDRLAESGNPLALDMTLQGGGDSPRIAVFVHGLCETDDAWALFGRRPYGARLEEELGYTPPYLPYNTGIHISDNGRRLARLLEETVESWPVPVEEIALVGHSMGGLVARNACHYGGDWTRLARPGFFLGAPHLGAPLEKAANAAAYALARLPETRAVAKVVNGRSVGIKDLRFGSCAEEDWCDCDPDEFMRDRCTEVPFLDCATYYFVGATLGRNPDSLVGDLLVRYPSASGSGRRRRIPFEVDHGMHLGGANHFQLLNHPAVYDQIVSWLAGRGSAAPDSRTLLPPRPRGGPGGRYPELSVVAGGSAPPGSE